MDQKPLMSRYSLPANLVRWLSGHKFDPDSVSSELSLEQFMQETQRCFSYSAEECKEETQVLLAEIAVLRQNLSEHVPEKLSQIQSRMPMQISELANYSKELKSLRRQLAQTYLTSTVSFSEESFSELLMRFSQQLDKNNPDEAALAKMIDNSPPSPHLLVAANNFLETHASEFKSKLKQLARASQLTVMCMVASNPPNQELYQRTSAVLSKVDSSLMDKHSELPGLLQQLETLKLEYLQLDKSNELQDVHIFSILEPYKVFVDSEQEFSGPLEAHQRILANMMKVIKEKEGTIAQMSEEISSLNANQQQASPHDLSIMKFIGTETLESSFQGNIDTIKQLTRQNTELLALLMDKNIGKRPLSKALKSTQSTHKDTDAIDQELTKLQDEIAASLEEPSFAESDIKDLNSSPNSKAELLTDRLTIENLQLKKELVEAEAKCVLLKQQTGQLGETAELKMLQEQLREKNRQMRDCIIEKDAMAVYLERLRRKNQKMSSQICAQEALKEKIRSLNFLYSKRENFLESMKGEVQRHKLRAQTAIRETRNEKYNLLKTIATLSEQLRQMDAVDLPPEVESALNIQNAMYEEDILKLQIEVEQYIDKNSKLKDRIAERDNTIRQTNQSIKDLEVVVSEKSAEIEELHGLITDQENVSLAREEEITQILKEENEKYSALEEENSNLISDLKDANERLNKLRNDFYKLADDKEALAKNCTTKDETIVKMEEETELLLNENRDLLNELENLTLEVREMDKIINVNADLPAPLESIQSESLIIDFKQEVDLLKQRLTAKNSKVQEIVEENKNNKSLIQKQTEEIKELKRLKAKNEASIQDMNKEKEEMLNSIQKNNEEYEEKQTQYVGQLENLNSQFNTLKEERDKLAELDTSNKKSLEDTAKKLKESMSKAEIFEKQLKSLQGDSKKSSKEESKKSRKGKTEEEPKEEEKKGKKGKKEGEEEKKSKRSKKDDNAEEEKKTKKGKKDAEEEKKDSKKKKGEEEKKDSKKSPKKGEEEKKESKSSKKTGDDEPKESKKSSKEDKKESKKSPKKGEEEKKDSKKTPRNPEEEKKESKSSKKTGEDKKESKKSPKKGDEANETKKSSKDEPKKTPRKKEGETPAKGKSSKSKN